MKKPCLKPSMNVGASTCIVLSVAALKNRGKITGGCVLWCSARMALIEPVPMPRISMWKFGVQKQIPESRLL